jgi:hypothetical protein
MNERIKQLAEQAGLKHHNWITNESNVKDGDFKYPRFEDYEKFAELIVQECMFQIKEEHNLNSNGTEPAGPYAHGFDDGMFVAIKTIQEHFFGVEE